MCYRILKTIKGTKDILLNMESSSLFLEDYRPVSMLINMKELRESSKFGVKKFNDAIYMGELENVNGGERNGKGVMVYKNGRIYEGNW